MAETSQTYARGVLTTDPIRNFRFLAKFTQLAGSAETGSPTMDSTIGFTSVSGLNISTESIPYREGQNNTNVRQIPGQTTFSPITFQRGVVLGSKQNWKWMRMLFRSTSNNDTIAAATSFRFNIEVSVLMHPVPYADKTSSFNPNNLSGASDDKTALTFTIYNAWPTSVAYSDLNAGDNALLVEQLTVVHEGIGLKWAKIGADKSFISSENDNEDEALVDAGADSETADF